MAGPAGRLRNSNPDKILHPQNIAGQNIAPQILTLLDAFDEILTLLGPFVPTEAVFGQITTALDDFRAIVTRSSGTDPIFSTLRFPRGRDPAFLYTKISARPGSGFSLNKHYISQKFSRCAGFKVKTAYKKKAYI